MPSLATIAALRSTSRNAGSRRASTSMWTLETQTCAPAPRRASRTISPVTVGMLPTLTGRPITRPQSGPGDIAADPARTPVASCLTVLILD